MEKRGQERREKEWPKGTLIMSVENEIEEEQTCKKEKEE